MKRARISIGALIFALACVSGVNGADLQQMADAIRYEATLPPNGEAGKPLPLLSHWCTGNFDLKWHILSQLSMIEDGHYLLPWAAFPMDFSASTINRYRDAFIPMAKVGLPFSFRMNQLETGLYNDEEYRALSAVDSPRVISTSGTLQRVLSPFGPVKHWHSVGNKVMRNATMEEIQKVYPNPPLVVFLSNNEPGTLRWKDVATSRRYHELYGDNKDPDFMRKVVGEGFIVRYRAYQEGMKEMLSPAWRENSKFVAYNEFPSAMGRYSGWSEYSLHTEDRISPAPLKWDGVSPSYYLHDWMDIWDYRIWSPQIEAMNFLVMLEEAYADNPDFWFELSIWDGETGKRKAYEARGQSFTPERYEGFMQYGMWLTRPRVMREFRSSTTIFADYQDYFFALARGVDRVHDNEVLRQWWRKGTLVANTAHRHQYQSALPATVIGKDRWYLLDADANPPIPASRTLELELKIVSLAYTRGVAPNREWLIYAHAPRGDEAGVSITIPNYKAVKVDVKQAGSFYTVSEANGAVVEVGDQ